MKPRWLDLIEQFDFSNLKDLPESAELISDNGISLIYRANGRIYKRSIPYLINNELYVLRLWRRTSRYVPWAERYDKYTIEMEDLGVSDPITDVEEFLQHIEYIGNMLKNIPFRHGDLTPANVIVKENVPKIIDWSESRFRGDFRADKRIEGDEKWLKITTEELIKRLAK